MDSNEWAGVLRSVSTYDTHGNITESMSYVWEIETNDWVMDGQYTGNNTYDATGNVTEHISYFWDSETNDWVGNFHRFYVYDDNGNKTEEGYFIWDSETSDWVYYFKEVSYWSELTTSVSNNIIDLNYIVYPNPFTDYTTIKLSDAVQTQKIELIDIHGRIVRTIDNINSNSVTIHREKLPSGIYFIRIHADDTYVKKVIIR